MACTFFIRHAHLPQGYSKGIATVYDFRVKKRTKYECDKRNKYGVMKSMSCEIIYPIEWDRMIV